MMRVDREEGENPVVEGYDNEEDVRKCMYCGEKHLARGMEGHVRWKDNDKHGPRDDLPDDYSLEKCEHVGKAPVRVDHGPTTDHSRFVCNHCGQVCRGKSGLGVHIKRSNDTLHDVDEINYGQHMEFPAYPDGRILVPREEYAAYIDLTEDEKADGFVVIVDDSLKEVNEIEISTPANKEELLDQIREEFMQYLFQNEQIDPVEAYSIVEKKFRTMPQKKDQ
jgi:hypothetical protein